jgi:hypothetical protein
LFVHDDGKCRYSNDVFGSEQEAISYAETCNANTADGECWDYYQHSSTSNDWKLIQHIEAKAALTSGFFIPGAIYEWLKL